MKAYGLTIKGNHQKNEDRILINNTIIADGSHYVECDFLNAFIADGVSSNNAGERAAEFVLEKLRNIHDLTTDSINTINFDLIRHSESSEGLHAMATTLSGLTITETEVKTAHIGNTRISALTGNCLTAVTPDHSLSTWTVATTCPNRKKAESYHRLNAIFGCLGGGSTQYAELLTVSDAHDILTHADKILITSDGIHDYLSEEELEDILNTPYPHISRYADEIIKKALEKGSEDDKSIIIIEI